MKDIWLLIWGIALLIGQAVCLFARKVWVRMIPVFITVALMAFCVIMYAASGFTNWGYLILLLLAASLLGAMGLLWLGYGIVRLVKKMR